MSKIINFFKKRAEEFGRIAVSDRTLYFFLIVVIIETTYNIFMLSDNKIDLIFRSFMSVTWGYILSSNFVKVCKRTKVKLVSALIFLLLFIIVVIRNLNLYVAETQLNIRSLCDGLTNGLGYLIGTTEFNKDEKANTPPSPVTTESQP